MTSHLLRIIMTRSKIQLKSYHAKTVSTPQIKHVSLSFVKALALQLPLPGILTPTHTSGPLFI